MTYKFELGRGFCTTPLPTRFHHPVFNRLEVIVLTNELSWTLLKTSTSLRYATPLGNNASTRHSEAEIERQLSLADFRTGLMSAT